MQGFTSKLKSYIARSIMKPSTLFLSALLSFVVIIIFFSCTTKDEVPFRKRGENCSLLIQPDLGFNIGMSVGEAESHKAKLLRNSPFKLNPYNQSWVDFSYPDNIPASFHLIYFDDTLNNLRIQLNDSSLACGASDKNINSVMGFISEHYGPPTETLLEKEEMWGMDSRGNVDMEYVRNPITYLNYFWNVQNISIRMRIDPNAHLCLDKGSIKANECIIIIAGKGSFDRQILNHNF